MDAMTSMCAAFVRAHVLSLSDQPASDLEGAEAIAASFREPAPKTGTALDAILERLRPAIAKSLNTAGPGYLAFIPGGGIYSAALADYVATSINRYVGVKMAAPALAQIESTAIAWVAEMMGCGAATGGILTTGGSLSTFTAVVTARTSKLPEDFLRGTLYVSSQTHLSVAKAARLAGFPADRVRSIEVDARHRMIPEAFERGVVDDRARGLTPFFVVANIGTTNTGAVDPLEDILAIAERHGLWVHADGAYGGFFRLVARAAALMKGLERCDSITLDPHKGLFLPYGNGCLLVRDPDALRRAHETDADYLRDVASEDGPPDFTNISPELSRDFRGLRLWLPLALHGVEAFRTQLDEKLRLARLVYDELASDPAFEMQGEPQLSIVCFRLRGMRGESAAQTDARGQALHKRVIARRRVFMSSTTLGGRFALRICVLSFRTHEERVREAIAALREEAATEPRA